MYWQHTHVSSDGISYTTRFSWSFLHVNHTLQRNDNHLLGPILSLSLPTRLISWLNGCETVFTNLILKFWMTWFSYKIINYFQQSKLILTDIIHYLTLAVSKTKFETNKYILAFLMKKKLRTCELNYIFAKDKLTSRYCIVSDKYKWWKNLWSYTEPSHSKL